MFVQTEQKHDSDKMLIAPTSSQPCKKTISTSARFTTNAMLSAVFTFSVTACLFQSFVVILPKIVKTKYV